MLSRIGMADLINMATADRDVPKVFELLGAHDTCARWEM